ncbi:isocitrate/isopropylmalate family dehydrogenase [Gordonia sp. ABSL1-1]|uniref:isocitrate/isopropylmalate dehydrogenase family protein n=1 Tax=Gordonia sp. ABSL1-1 TaxID=3053923 RepID=UPI002573AC69|nr:isocitrate/isopropylmalate family dehydrogenase [Gordonia sp. ABSL1-1]MDL9938176.1 isocitrate/isopropylmalate family dehydrogenase [Gordonia sp. ABSL1-1]
MSADLRIGVMHGDGIGPEIVPGAVSVAEAALARVGVVADWVELPLGRTAIDTYRTPMPAETLAALDDLDIWILGPHDSAGYPAEFAGELTPGAVIRKRYDLFANLRPCRAFAGVPATAPDIDVLIARENSEGLYADRNMAVGSGEFMPTPDIALAVGVITRAASERIAHQAFRLAQRRSRHVTVVHKANVLTMTTGLFRDACRAVAAEYPDVTVDEQHVDAMAALLIRRPADFDVLVTENLFGDILSDLAAELAGSLGLAGSVNCSDVRAMAQAAHGAAPDIAGRGIANPVAIIASTAMLLRWQGARTDDDRLLAAADLIDTSTAAALASGVATPDVGGTSTTRDVVDAIVGSVNPG